MKLWELFDAPPALDEALSQPLPWEWKIKERASWGAKFAVGEMAYWVYLDGPDGGMVQVTFTDGDHREDVTGSGGAFQVFGTVADIMRSFLSHRNPSSLYFTAKEPSRRALYQRLAGKAAGEVGGRVTRISDGGSQGYQIVLPQPVEEARLDELLDKPAKFEVTRERGHWEGHFQIEDETYSITAWLDDEDVPTIALLSFDNVDKGNGITGSGNSFQVFATVKRFATEYVSANKPDLLRFSSDDREPSRKKLYDRMASQIAASLNCGFKVKDLTGQRVYELDLRAKTKDLKEDGKIIPGVNTTHDVQPGETERQAAKFGNALDSQGRPPLLRGSYGDDSARFSANQGDPFYGENGTRLPKNKKWT